MKRVAAALLISVVVAALGALGLRAVQADSSVPLDAVSAGMPLRGLGPFAPVAGSSVVADPARPRALLGAASRDAVLADDGILAYVPLVARNMTLDMLEPPRTPQGPTEIPQPSATPQPSETPTPAATVTPEPSPTPTVAPLDAEESDDRVELDGSWQMVTDRLASGGAYAKSATKGDTLTVRFAGDHIVVYRTMAPDGGQAEVKVDGKSYGYLQCYFTERRYQVPGVIDNLPEGSHTLTLTVSDRKPRGSSGTNMYIDRLQAPSNYGFSEAHEEALARANYYRDLTGLPRIRGDRAIHLAAQGHADYDKRNPGGGHRETPGRPGFIGVRFSDRLRYFGYAQPSGEVMYWSTRLTPSSSVDSWVATVYHRIPFMSHASTDLGYGEAKGSRMTTSVIDFGSRDHVPPKQRLIVTYPVDGQTDVPLGWRHTSEAPDPLPGQPADVGYPISLHIAQSGGGELAMEPWLWSTPYYGLGAQLTAGPASAEWSVDSAVLTTSSGGTVPAYVIDKSNDKPGYLREDVVFIMAKQFMAPNATYNVHVTGSDSKGVPFDVQWSFTTGSGLDNAAGDVAGPR